MNSSDSLVSSRSITVTVKAVGYHFWEGAPPEVSFLRQPHRHVFTFRCTLNVAHNDRDLEFFIMQRNIRAAVSEMAPKMHGELQFAERSCEQLAVDLHKVLFGWGFKPSAIEVWEDDENGARVEFAS